MGVSIGRLLGVVLGATLLLGLAAPTAMALPATPNTSFVTYRPPTATSQGKVVLGTLAAGVYTKTGSFKTGRWSHIAIGRDTMALYDKGTGRLTTGKLRNGVWKQIATTTIRKGYTDVVASCDTILFYRRSTGVGMTAELSSGGIRDKREVAMTPGITLLQASCDTFLGITPGDPSIWTLGLLQSGRYTFGSTKLYSTNYNRLAVNTDSLLVILAEGTGPYYGFWGTLTGGTRSYVSERTDFGVWKLVAGAADSLLFYQPAYGTVATATLAGGEYGQVATTPPTFPLGITILAGGR